MVFSVAEEYYQFMLGFSVLGSISSSIVFIPSVACIAHWFLKRRALATGIAATAGGIGGIIFPSRLPWAIRIIGFISAAFCFLNVALLRTRLPLNSVQKGIVDIRALKELRFSLLTAAIVLIDFALLIPLTYLPSYAQSRGLGDSLAYNLSSILNAASIVGRIIPRYCASRFGRCKYISTLIVIPIAGELFKVQISTGHDDYTGLIILCGLVYACACVFFILSKGVSVGWRLKVF
ncbi:hypothetical protein N7449_003092 [Penicillium cf. viridicatum]|uniref:Major facilitator superfamily (MFS) profile domain-containing protein n=1 Tax=Penicillium cf. viridicatum TaxID=2972119 RepID=A0A9W9T437_9EURO|nr:hypothetical protein N7449_003092 [Penicillium cf. viridicatum]